MGDFLTEYCMAFLLLSIASQEARVLLPLLFVLTK